MKTITRALLLFFLCTNLVQAYEVEEYRGVKVNHISNLCNYWGDAAGCYFYRGSFQGQINIAWHEDEEHYIDILNHELAHDIWYVKMSNAERDLYRLIELGYLDDVIEAKGILMGQCNVSDYATTSVEEDFADTMMFYMRGDYRKTLEDKCDLKVLLATYFINKYEGKH